MSWEDFNLARVLLVEERIGTRHREKQAVEDAGFKATAKRLPKG